MRYVKIFALGYLLGLFLSAPAFSQQTRVVADCAATGLTWSTSDLGRQMAIDSQGRVCNNFTPYPSDATPVTNTAAGTTGATVATLPGVAAKTTYVCGYLITSRATAATIGSATLVGIISGTLTFGQAVAASPALAESRDQFYPCIPASAANTSIVLTSVAAGTAGVTNVFMYGYQR